MHRMLVRDLMQHPVVTIQSGEPIADAAQLMEEHDIRRLPVVDDRGCIIGIVTETDIGEAEAADSVINKYDPAANRGWLTVDEIMARDLITIGPEATVGELVQIFLDKKLGGIPVIITDPRCPRRKYLVGIVTEMDIFRMIADSWERVQGEMDAPRSIAVQEAIL